MFQPPLLAQMRFIRVNTAYLGRREKLREPLGHVPLAAAHVERGRRGEARGSVIHVA